MATFTSLILSLDILTLFGTFILLYIVKFYISYFTRENPLPGPLPLPLVGNLIQLILAKDTNEWALAAQAKYGDIWEAYIGREKQIWLARADLVERVMTASKNNKFIVRNPPNSGLDLLEMSSKGTLFNRDKEKWYFNRKIFAQTLTTVKFSKLVTKWTQQVFANMEGYFTELGYDEKAFNFAEWTPRATADITFLVSMSKHGCTLASLYNSYNPSKPAPYSREKVVEAENLILAVKKYTATLKYFLMTPEFIRTMTPFGRKQAKTHLDNLAWLRSTLLEIIQEKKKAIENIEKPQLIPDFLTLLVTVNTPKDITQNIGHNTIEEPLTDDDIRVSLTEMITAGIDTVSKKKKICSVITHPPAVFYVPKFFN
jgi:cytochrome P450